MLEWKAFIFGDWQCFCVFHMVSLCVNVTLNVEAVAYTFTGPGANFIFMHSFIYVKSNHVSHLYGFAHWCHHFDSLVLDMCIYLDFCSFTNTHTLTYRHSDL